MGWSWFSGHSTVIFRNSCSDSRAVLVPCIVSPALCHYSFSICCPFKCSSSTHLLSTFLASFSSFSCTQPSSALTSVHCPSIHPTFHLPPPIHSPTHFSILPPCLSSTHLSISWSFIYPSILHPLFHPAFHCPPIVYPSFLFPSILYSLPLTGGILKAFVLMLIVPSFIGEANDHFTCESSSVVLRGFHGSLRFSYLIALINIVFLFSVYLYLVLDK